MKAHTSNIRQIAALSVAALIGVGALVDMSFNIMEASPTTDPRKLALPAPLGLPPLELLADNPPTQAQIELGRKLFMDRRLAHNDTLSCAMCHVPEQGFAFN